MTSPYLSIVLPIYNEEQRLGKCLARLLDYFWHYTHIPFEIVCVLNGCTDRSFAIARQFSKRWPQMNILSLPEAGKGAAIKAGMLAAMGKYRMMMDVDLATPPTEIPRFLKAAWSGVDLVAGVRTYRHASPLRRLAHSGYRLLARPLTWVRDPQCGFKLFTAACADDVFSHLKTTGWGFDVEALYLAGDGYRIVELEVPWIHDNNSKLHIFRDSVKMARDLLLIRKLHKTT